MAADYRRYWFSRARRLAAEHNLARWLDFFLPALVVVSVTAAAVLLVLRDRRADPPWFFTALGGVMVATGLASAAGLRRRALGVREALTRLDEQGGLHTRLTSALAGIGPWPAPRSVRDGIEPRWSRLFTPSALSAGLLAAGAFVPLPDHESRTAPTERPLAWSQVESWLDALEQSKTVEPPALEKLRQQLSELQQQPAEKWYRQSSLEAGENLRSEARQAMQNLQRDLHETEKVVAETGRQDGRPAPDRLRQMEGALAQAIEGLQTGTMPLNQELLKQLKDFQPGQVRQFSPEQMDQLRERLRQSQQVCERCVGPRPGEGDPEQQQAGGEGGGGKEAPLTFARAEKKTPSRQSETVASNDLSTALPGDLEAITAGEHEVKKDLPAGPVAGGEIASPGQGGDTVWRTSILPAERGVLQKFFK